MLNFSLIVPVTFVGCMIIIANYSELHASWAIHHLLIKLSLEEELLGRVVHSPVKLTQARREFWFEFSNFAVSFSVYIVCPSVLSLNNLILPITEVVKNIFRQEKLMLWLTFNPGLALTGFGTTRPDYSKLIWHEPAIQSPALDKH